jgi:hypothetical protein
LKWILYTSKIFSICIYLTILLTAIF